MRAGGSGRPDSGRVHLQRLGHATLDLQDPEGQRHTLHDWHGKVILLNFWASWCGPCQAEVPDLVRYQREYAGQGLQVIGVGLDELSRIRNFIRTFGITYPVLVSDPSRGHELLPRWGDPRQILPFTVVIGRDGHIHFMQVGPLGEEAFADYVLPLLNAPPPGRQHEYTPPQNTSETQLSGVGRWNGGCRARPQRFRVGWEPGGKTVCRTDAAVELQGGIYGVS